MATATRSSYHHGDLRAALLDAAMVILERGEAFSIRAIARAAGVSPAAPYRHFPDREALESALAARGLRDLTADLSGVCPLPRDPVELSELGAAYVDFALRRPALFRLMFGQECDHELAERVQAAAELNELLTTAIANVYPESDQVDVALGGWGLVHGLACLYLDRKLISPSREQAVSQARSSILAVMDAGRG